MLCGLCTAFAENFKPSSAFTKKKKMKIGILTQPLFCNYGGILQAYALQTVLQGLGHTVERLDLYDFSLRYRMMVLIKSLYLKYIRRNKDVSMSNPFCSSYARFNYDLVSFIKGNIESSPLLSSSKSLAKYVKRNDFDAIIVGSDQVWRAAYTPFITDYFLSFLPVDSRIKRIAYAASIGGETLDIKIEQKEVCGQALRRFVAVSVREASACELLKLTFGVEASVQLDPTLLLEKAAYLRLIPPHRKDQAQFWTHYILDMNEERNDC